MRLSSALPCLALLLGCAAPRETPEPAVQAAARAPSAPPKLPPCEVLDSTVSPDGTSWCIQNVRIEERVPGKTLRAIWESLRKQQPLEWRRFTCRFHLPDQSSWADVNEVTIFETPRPVPHATGIEADEEAALVVEEGDGYVIIEVQGVEIRKQVGPGEHLIWITNPYTGEEYAELAGVKYTRVPLPLSDEPRLPPCGSALMR